MVRQRRSLALDTRSPRAFTDALDTSETDMAGRRVDFLGVPCRRAVPPAVVRRAEMRSALEHPARDFHSRRRIDARIGIGIAGIARNAAGLGGRFRMAHGPK